MSRATPIAPPPMAALLWQARPIRFLILLVAGWALMRVMLYGAAMRQDIERAMPPPRWSAAATPPQSMVPERKAVAVTAAARVPATRHDGDAADWAKSLRASALPVSRARGAGSAFASAGGADRHMLRLAMLGNLVPSPALMRSAAVSAPFGPMSPWLSAPPAAAPLRVPGATATSALDRWSLSGWAVLRSDGGTARPASPGFGGATLGGSQAGVRLARRLDRSGRVEAFLRLAMPVRRPEGADAAVGLSWRPARRIPVALAVEQRFAVGRAARTAPAAYAAGGVSDIGLPGGFRLDAYGQAGVVGVQRPALFADGAASIEHGMARIGGAPLSAGAMVAAAAQPGAARVDVGPRVSLRFPAGAQNSRLSLDWRARVAGDAQPGSGLALTLAGDF